MIYIAHRGNLEGPDPEKENHPDYIRDALQQGFDVEVDVWFIDGKFILGHDKPQYEVKEEFILNDQFWHHAKDIKTLFKINDMKPNYLINCFYHDSDACTLTSGGWIWTYPGMELTKNSIAVLPEKIDNWQNLDRCYGICTDYTIKFSQQNL